jgi:excinuclease UvrABC ATPase subunit
MATATGTGTKPPAQHPADSHDLIRVQGARVNNLKDVSVELPKRRLTVFTGVSGSGKSSLVFGTIAAESQRPAPPRPSRSTSRPSRARGR